MYVSILSICPQREPVVRLDLEDVATSVDLHGDVAWRHVVSLALAYAGEDVTSHCMLNSQRGDIRIVSHHRLGITAVVGPDSEMGPFLGYHLQHSLMTRPRMPHLNESERPCPPSPSGS